MCSHRSNGDIACLEFAGRIPHQSIVYGQRPSVWAIGIDSTLRSCRANLTWYSFGVERLCSCTVAFGTCIRAEVGKLHPRLTQAFGRKNVRETSSVTMLYWASCNGWAGRCSWYGNARQKTRCSSNHYLPIFWVDFRTSRVGPPEMTRTITLKRTPLSVR